MTPESKAKSSVTKSLEALKASGDIIWWTRLQSGMFSVDGNFCHASEKGTFDLVAIFRGKDKNLCLSFIEVKRDDKPAKLSETQETFKSKYSGKHPNIFFWLVQSGQQVSKLILQRAFDRVADVEFEP